VHSRELEKKKQYTSMLRGQLDALSNKHMRGLCVVVVIVIVIVIDVCVCVWHRCKTNQRS